VVDDEVSIIDFVRIYLEREKFSVIAYMDGLSALNGIRNSQPALVVLDIMLPKMDGYDVCRTLRAEENEEPIIMLSAKDEDIDKILGLRVGCR
jgi:DNA-binding response OmpR family regulator